jgi:hypothetical protein
MKSILLRLLLIPCLLSLIPSAAHSQTAGQIALQRKKTTDEVTATGPGYIIESITPVADGIWVFDGTGDPTVVTSLAQSVITNLTTDLGNKQPLDADLTSIASLITTSFGRGLLDEADALAARATLGVSIDLDVQAYNANLDAISALTTTAYGLDLLELADAAALQSYAGLIIGTNVQAADPTLTALAGVTFAANQGLYATAADTFSVYSLTAGGRALGGAAGTANTFPYFSASNTVSLATLSAGGRTLANTTAATDTIPYYTSSSTASTTSFTSTARSLLDDTSVSAMRTTLGMGTAAVANIGTGNGEIPVYGSIPVEIGVACSDETTAITSGTGKVTFRMPHAMTLTGVRASVTTAPTGAAIVIDINEDTGGGATTVLSTKLSIDATEKTSTTAATAAVISDSALADDSEITIDFDQVGSTIAGTGVKIWLIGTR